MKRKLPALLLAALLLISLSMTALAADTPTYGAYNVKAESGYTLMPDGTADGGFYANASAFTLSCPAGTSGEQTLALLLAGESSSVPTADNLQYIDQQASNGSISFTLKPKELTAGTSYSVYLSTTSKDVIKVASFQYGEKPAYTLGDVDGNGKIEPADALWILQSLVDAKTLDDSQILAADIDKNGKIEPVDALKILQYLVDIIPSLG